MKKLLLSILAIMALIPACGGHKKSAVKMLSLQKNMSMGQVRAHMGEPDKVAASSVDHRGNQIDVWEYNLGIFDEDKNSTKVMFQVGGWLAFWPLLCFPQAWRSSWTFDTYFFKFVNKALLKWGRKIDIIDVSNEYTQANLSTY